MRCWPWARHWDETEEFPQRSFEALGRADLLGITIDPAYGGAGLGDVESSIVLEELGRVDVSSAILAQLLPYLIVVWGFYGAVSLAGDIVAGEKERQTLETLLMSPRKRSFRGRRPWFQQRRDQTSQVLRAFLNRLQTVTVLDPACGSGNFLFVTLWIIGI